MVLAECDLQDTDFAGVRQRRLLELLFDIYPNRVSPIGSRGVVEVATSSELRELHDTYYVPTNAQLVLTGDVDAAGARALAERFFGDRPCRRMHVQRNREGGWIGDWRRPILLPLELDDGIASRLVGVDELLQARLGAMGIDVSRRRSRHDVPPLE